MHMGHNTYLVFVIDAFHILNSLTHGNNKIFNLTKYTENKKNQDWIWKTVHVIYVENSTRWIGLIQTK